MKSMKQNKKKIIQNQQEPMLHGEKRQTFPNKKKLNEIFRNETNQSVCITMSMTTAITTSDGEAEYNATKEIK